MSDFVLKNFNKLLYRNTDFKNGKIHIYILSFGITYKWNFDKGLLDYCDYFVTRSTNDLKLINQRYGKNYSLYLPDLGFLLKDLLIKTKNLTNMETIQIKYNIRKTNKNVGVFLASTILKEQNKNIINELSEIIKIILNDNYEVYLFNFGSNENNNIENDIRINKKIFDNLKNHKNLKLKYQKSKYRIRIQRIP